MTRAAKCEYCGGFDFDGHMCSGKQRAVIREEQERLRKARLQHLGLPSKVKRGRGGRRKR